MTADLLADRLTARLHRSMQRISPLRGWRLWAMVAGYFLLYLVPVFLFACWLTGALIAESLKKPEGV